MCKLKILGTNTFQIVSAYPKGDTRYCECHMIVKSSNWDKKIEAKKLKHCHDVHTDLASSDPINFHVVFRICHCANPWNCKNLLPLQFNSMNPSQSTYAEDVDDTGNDDDDEFPDIIGPNGGRGISVK